MPQHRIGDYVHYNWTNYVFHGLERRQDYVEGESPHGIADANAVFNAQHEYARKAIEEMKRVQNKARHRELEKTLNMLLHPEESGEEGAIEVADQVWKKYIEPGIVAEFGQKAGTIIRSTGNVVVSNARSQVTDKQTKTRGALARQENAQAIYGSTIFNTLFNIKHRLEDGAFSEATLQDFNAQLTELRDTMFELIQVDKDAWEGNDYLPKSSHGYYKLKDEKIMSLVKSTNILLARIKLNMSLQKGWLFEKLIEIAPAIIEGNGYKTIKEELFGTNLGGKGDASKVQFDPKFFIAEANMREVLGTKYKYNANNTVYESTLATQNKVDVQITYNGDKSNPLNISAKNVSLTKNVHLVSSASLLAMVQHETPEFVTHWMNQHGNNYKGEVSPKGEEALKLTLLRKAAEGHKEGADKANTFIINNNLIGRVQVFDMGEMVEKAMKGGYYEIEGLPKSLNNSWGTTWQARINKVLGSMHQSKITVSIQPEMFL